MVDGVNFYIAITKVEEKVSSSKGNFEKIDYTIKLDFKSLALFQRLPLSIIYFQLVSKASQKILLHSFFEFKLL